MGAEAGHSCWWWDTFFLFSPNVQDEPRRLGAVGSGVWLGSFFLCAGDRAIGERLDEASTGE
jgi:hypothetical protein